MEKIISYLSFYINALIQNIKNLFLDKESRVYTGAIPEF